MILEIVRWLVLVSQVVLLLVMLDLFRSGPPETRLPKPFFWLTYLLFAAALPAFHCLDPASWSTWLVYLFPWIYLYVVWRIVAKKTDSWVQSLVDDVGKKMGLERNKSSRKFRGHIPHAHPVGSSNALRTTLITPR